VELKGKEEVWRRGVNELPHAEEKLGYCGPSRTQTSRGSQYNNVCKRGVLYRSKNKTHVRGERISPFEIPGLMKACQRGRGGEGGFTIATWSEKC